MATREITGYDPTTMQWAEIQVSTAEGDAPTENECLQTLIRLHQQRQARHDPKMSAKVGASPSMQQARFDDAASAKDASALPSPRRNAVARWRPAQTPRVRSEDMIIVLKPRTTLDIRKVFRHGDAGTAIAGHITGVSAGDLNVWPIWEQNVLVCTTENLRVADQLINDFDLRVREASYPFRGHLKIKGEPARGNSGLPESLRYHPASNLSTTSSNHNMTTGQITSGQDQCRCPSSGRAEATSKAADVQDAGDFPPLEKQQHNQLK
ncbi:hypothetical protein HPB52_011329 [Rhipicephalus sanguineus]|uniref:Uncharacterized protein n=1 Tax=Rhipicephalus sanguineus TaxID=34632 RepID=A0A9D4PME9_RHISA|nr:hypothetical protein HPB52_011329 [Rhipicephalus sanguineus]